MRRAKPTLPASLLMTLSVVMALLLLGADLASAQGTATIRGHIYTGATRVDGTPVLHSEDAGLTPPITTAKVMVQNQHSGGAFIAYATVDPGTNFWHASVPVPGDYVVMFSAPGHDATSREFAVALDGEIQEQDAYLPKLFASPFDPAVPSTDKLPRAGFLMYVFYENQINGEDDAPDDPPLNGATVWAEDEDGNVLATGISGIGNYALPGDPPNSAIKTLPFPGAPGGLILTSIDGLCYFDNLPPTEVMIYTDASTAYLYDVDGPLSLGPVPNLANRDPITNEPIPLDFAPTSEFYLLSSEEGGVGFEAVLYPGDPGLEDGGYLGWHGYVPKLGQIGSPTNPTPFDPGTAGSIETILNDADMAFDVLEPEDALVQIMHPGVTANTFVPDAFVVLATDDETLAGRAVATAEPYYWDPAIDPVPLHPDGYVNLENVPPGRYKLFACDSPIDYVYIKM